MIPILIEVGLLAVGGVFSAIDYVNARSMEDSKDQFAAYYDLLANQTTFYDFIGQAWPSLLFMAGVLLLGFTIAHPKRRPVRRNYR